MGLNLEPSKFCMEYSKLVESYEKVESTQSNLEKTSILAKLYRQSDEDLEDTVMLSLGRISPSWEGLDLGISSKTLVDIIVIASGRSKEEVEEVWKTQGDLGDAAETMMNNKTQQRLMTQTLEVSQVMERLRKVAEMDKDGISQSVNTDKKKKMIADLLSSAKPQEARYLARTVLENLRIGIGEGTVRDALDEAYFEGSNSEEIQRAYDMTNDFRKVAEACREGEEALEKLDLQLFRPIKSMLAQKVDTIEEGFNSVGRPAAVDYKYDGMRCIAGETPIYVEKKGITPVRSVDIGDKVLTHNGNFREVTATNKRTVEVEEQIFELSTAIGNDFKITEGHEILTENGWTNVENLDAEKDRVIFPIPNINPSVNFPKQVEFSRNGDTITNIGTEPGFWRLLGYWLGSDYSGNPKNLQQIKLLFEEQETQLFENYAELQKEVLKIPEKNIDNYINSDCKELYWPDKTMLEWLSHNFTNQSGKSLPKWFWSLDKNYFESFLEGWTDSSGCRDAHGNKKSTTTGEKEIATTVQLIALKHGILAGVELLKEEGQTYYRVVFPDSETAVIEDGKLKLEVLEKKELFENSSEEADNRLEVYNLQVYEDESYCTTTVALHNCQIHIKDNKAKLYTRRLEDVTKQFPDVKKTVESQIDGENCIIDTEIVGVKDGEVIPFQQLSQRIKRKYDIERLKNEIPVEVRPFDLLYLEKSYLEQPYEKRLEKLREAVKENDNIKFANQIITSDVEEVNKLQQKALDSDHEGVMMKSLSAEYNPGSRVGYMVKLKPVMETLDLAIIGAQWSEGRKSGWLGRLKLGCWNPESEEYEMLGRMSSGLTDKQLEEVTERLKPLIIDEEGRDVELKPEVLLEVEYEEIQKSPTYSSGYALRFPRLKKFRDDKDIPDSKEKVKRLYNTQ